MAHANVWLDSTIETLNIVLKPQPELSQAQRTEPWIFLLSSCVSHFYQSQRSIISTRVGPPPQIDFVDIDNAS